MTTIDTADTTYRGYEVQLLRELAVLPSRSRRRLLQDLSEHADGTADERGFAEYVGEPSVIARAALEQHDTYAGRSLRPSLLMPSKLLQLAAAVVASPLAVIALLDLLAGGSVFGLPRIVLWVLIALPPLLARWTTWWRTSVACTILYACYLTVALSISLGGGAVPAAGIVFLVSTPIAVAHALALALSVAALLLSPKVLRTR